MRLLLDTHSLLWALGSPATLARTAREAIDSTESVVYVSTGTLWECAIKAGLGKLQLPDGFFQSLQPAGFELLDIRVPHLEVYLNLPLHHRDPFDRILVAQAISEQLTLVTRDREIARYDVQALEA